MSDKIKSLLKKKKRITLDDYPSIRDSLDITISNREIFRLIQEHVFKIVSPLASMEKSLASLKSFDVIPTTATVTPALLLAKLLQVKL